MIILKEQISCAFYSAPRFGWASICLICAVSTQSIASLEAKLKNCREQHLTLQEELEKAKQSYRKEALLVHLGAHAVEEEIQKAQESGSRLPLLNNIYLAHRAVVGNSEAITQAEQQMAQNRQEMRKQENDIASLKAERKQELTKVRARPIFQMPSQYTHKWYNNHVYLHFAELYADRKQCNGIESCSNRADWPG